jgi:ABC-type Fe3+ transport system permease subunit
MKTFFRIILPYVLVGLLTAGIYLQAQKIKTLKAEVLVCSIKGK